ncbi:MAG: PBP1 and LysM peptidoglycan-binding domain-containing protein [Bacteroidales bacterium]
MNRDSIIIALLFLILSVPSLMAQHSLPKKMVEGKEYYIYTVQPAEGFYSITRRFGVTEDMIRSANGGLEKGLKSGDAILIPSTAKNGTTEVKGDSLKDKSKTEVERVRVGYFVHTVEKKQTLSAISRLYSVTIDELEDLNPGAKEKLKAGRILRIPKYEERAIVVEPKEEISQLKTHIIQPKETLYSISRAYGVTIESLVSTNPGLSAETFSIGRTILIPNSSLTPITPSEEIKGVASRYSVNAVILLPFNAGNYNPRDLNQRRFVEYYEGLLMAMDSLKRRGVSIRLDVYDTQELDRKGTDYTTLNGLSDANIIIGPTQNEQIAKLNTFAAERKIPILLPFTSRSDVMDRNPYAIQINTPQLHLYPEVVNMYVDRFRSKKVIFIKELGKSGDKAELCKQLRERFYSVGIEYVDYSYTPEDVEIKPELFDTNSDYMIIPENGASESLKSLLPLLQIYKKANPAQRMSLFGYPEWQTFVKDFIEAFYILDTHIYSSFYAENNSPRLNAFYTSYKRWYQRDVMNSYPKFGALGFDTGLFFLQAIANGKDSPIQEITRRNYDGIQSGFKMSQMGTNGGLINRNLYLIQYTPEYDIIKKMIK